MEIVKCPKCHNDVELDISKACDEDAEVFVCPHCKWKFRYAKK
jgi:uncharacterized protein YbaR (Trm112 family)